MTTTSKKVARRAASALGATIAIVALNAPAALAGNPLAGLLSALSGKTNIVCRIDAENGTPAGERIPNGSPLSATALRGPIHELAQFSLPSNGMNLSGTLFHEALEGCTLPITGGSLVLNSSGIGKLTLDLSIGTIATDQGDLMCSALFGGQTTFTETFNAVLAPSKPELELVGEETFVPPAGGTAVVPVRGACVRQ